MSSLQKSTTVIGPAMACSSPEDAASGSEELELSVVMPCLNEARTLGRCIRAAQTALERHRIRGEIVVADNGSTDGSRQIAARLGVRIVAVSDRGYGNALRGGIHAARGRYIIMGDGDDSYDFGEIPRFLAPLRQGYDFVMGNRFRGAIQPGAMPWKNRYLGNPMLSAVGQVFFGSRCGDFHCGLRAFNRASYRRMVCAAHGMEFASEMVIQATMRGLRITEVPVTLRRDGRSRPSHLRPWRDGWLHLRLMLLYSPRWLFFYPGIAALGLGLLILVLGLMDGLASRAGCLDASMLSACLLGVGGMQAIGLSLLGKQFTEQHGLHPPNRLLSRLLPYLNMEWGLVCGFLLAGIGAAGFAVVTFFPQVPPADPAYPLRQGLPFACLFLLGMQTTLLGCFSSLLGMRRN